MRVAEARLYAKDPVFDGQSAAFETIKQDIIDNYGYVVAGGDLCQILGIKSLAALRQAKYDGRLPTIPILQEPGRRGFYATANDLAMWLVRQREGAIKKVPFYQ